ncbi:hypothetical protein IAD21_00895 [Abditibacteriota bacterium]|nr:hypothetical protein IAD21_00895 [Abditibacteriota bacterium]
MINLQEKQRELTQKSKELDELITAKSSASADELKSFQAPDGELQARQKEISDLSAELSGNAEMLRYQDQIRTSMKMANLPNYQGMFGGGGSGTSRIDLRSPGQRFVESAEYKERSADLKMRPIEAKFEGDAGNIKAWLSGKEEDAAIKATLTTTAGFAPFYPRTDRVVPLGQIAPIIADYIPHTTTTMAGGRYMEETTYTNTAAIVPEGTAKPEAALAFTERQFQMIKVAETLPVTDEQLADVPQIRGVIDNRLGLMVRQAVDGLLLNNTAATGFDGFLQKASVQNVAQAAGEALPTTVLRAITQIQYQPGFANPTAFFMNPLDWLGYVTYQTTTGAYVVGSPSDSAIMTMWGRPIVPTNRMPQGTALIGDFQTYSEIYDREELNIRVGYIGNDFINNILRILAETRFTLNIYRGSAFAKITGINFS